MALPELTDLARALESSDPDDRGAYEAGLQRLVALQDQARRGNAPNLATCLAAVSRLIEALAEEEDLIPRDQVRSIACGVLDSLGGAQEDVAEEGEEPEDEEPAVDEEQAADDEPISGPEPAPEPEPDPPKPSLELRLKHKADMVLGRMLIELGHVQRDQVAAALRFHRKKGPQIGECLLLQGAIAPQHLLHALRIQELLRATPEGITPETLARYGESATPELPEPPEPPGPPEPKNDPYAAARRRPPDAPQRVTESIFLGEVLLGAEMITNDQLEKAMHLHHHKGLRVGDALIELGALTREEVENGVELQKQLRRIAGLKAV